MTRSGNLRLRGARMIVKFHRHHAVATITPETWLKPGGVVWVALATHLLVYLGLYIGSFGILPPDPHGFPYVIPERAIRPGEVQRLAGGNAITAHGQVILDPGVDDIEIYTVDAEGIVALRHRSSARRIG